MKYKKTSRFIDILDKIVDGYNNSFHSSIGTTPNAAHTGNVMKTAERLYYSEIDPINTLQQTPKFKRGDHVLISRLKGQYKKGYTSNYSPEIFKIEAVKKTIPVQYSLVDICENESSIAGFFYEKELTGVIKPKFLTVNSILDVRTKRGGRREFKVTFHNTPKCDPTWVSAGYLKKAASAEELKKYKISK